MAHQVNFDPAKAQKLINELRDASEELRGAIKTARVEVEGVFNETGLSFFGAIASGLEQDNVAADKLVNNAEQHIANLKQFSGTIDDFDSQY